MTGPLTSCLMTGMTSTSEMATGWTTRASMPKRPSTPCREPARAMASALTRAPTNTPGTSATAERQDVSSESTGSQVRPVMKAQKARPAKGNPQERADPAQVEAGIGGMQVLGQVADHGKQRGGPFHRLRNVGCGECRRRHAAPECDERRQRPRAEQHEEHHGEDRLDDELEEGLGHTRQGDSHGKRKKQVGGVEQGGEAEPLA